MSFWKNKILFLVLALFGVSSVQAELRTLNVFGDLVVEDTVSHAVWNPEVHTRKNVTQANTFCGDQTLAGLSDWEVPMESEIVSF